MLGWFVLGVIAVKDGDELVFLPVSGFHRDLEFLLLK